MYKMTIKPPQHISRVQEVGSISKIGLSLLMSTHLHWAYVVGVCRVLSQTVSRLTKSAGCKTRSVEEFPEVDLTTEFLFIDLEYNSVVVIRKFLRS